jgi:hypothetical protein
MPSPFGPNRSSDAYYQFGGLAKHYDYNWQGMPFPQAPRAKASLGSRPDDIYTDLGDAGDGLGDYGPGHPVSMSMESGRRSLLSTMPDQMKMAYGVPVPMGAFGLSRNEQRLAIAAAGFGKKGRRRK